MVYPFYGSHSDIIPEMRVSAAIIFIIGNVQKYLVKVLLAVPYIVQNLVPKPQNTGSASRRFSFFALGSECLNIICKFLHFVDYSTIHSVTNALCNPAPRVGFNRCYLHERQQYQQQTSAACQQFF